MKAKLLSITMSLIMCFCVSAQNPEFNFIEQDELPYTFIEQNGLIYQILEEPSEGNAFGKVSLYSWTIGGDTYKYKGDIVIPTAIQNGDGDFADKYRVVALGYHLFDDCDELLSVTYPEQRNGIYIYGQTFKNTPKLKFVKFPKPDKGADSFKSIEPEAFINSGIEQLVIPEGFTFIGYSAFENSKLKNVVLPQSLKKIGSNAFASCNLSEITFNSSIISNYGAEVFAGCPFLTHITFNEPVELIGDGFFAGIQSDSLLIEGNIRELGVSCFASCKATRIVLPSSVEIIGDRCFSDCYNLESFNLPINIKVLKNNIFRGCELKTISVPAGIESIGEDALGSTYTLERVEIECPEEKIPYIYRFKDTDGTIPRGLIHSKI